ncbi:MAG: HAD family hydrolase [Planctomycetaceae bacterium]
MNTAIKCVAFDAVGTIIDCEPSVSAIYAEVASNFGSHMSATDVGKKLGTAMAVFDEDSAEHDFRTTEAREFELWKEVVRRVVDDVDRFDEFFDELHERFGQPDVWRLCDNVASTFEALQQQGITVAIASNFDGRLHKVCDAYPELADISIRVISSEVGYRKPSLGYYNGLTEACGCPANEILMVGDTPLNDDDGAVAAGLNAVLVDRTRDADLPQRISCLSQIVELISA